jgi:hypothetical protein
VHNALHHVANEIQQLIPSQILAQNCPLRGVSAMCLSTFFARSSPTVTNFEMTVPVRGPSQTHLSTSMPPGAVTSPMPRDRPSHYMPGSCGLIDQCIGAMHILRVFVGNEVDLALLVQLIYPNEFISKPGAHMRTA